MEKMTNEIMRTLAVFAKIASEELTSKLAWRAEAETQLAQAKQKFSNGKTATELEEALDEIREARGNIDYRERWVMRAQGYEAAVKQITESLQHTLEVSQECEETETQEEELLELSA